MAWTTPRTWTTSELVTASIGNTHWRDNLNYLYTSALLTLIADSTLGADAASFDVQNIAATYAHLSARHLLRGAGAASNYQLEILINNDSGTNYEYAHVEVTNSSVSGAAGSGQNNWVYTRIPAAGAPASWFGAGQADFPHYAGTTAFKGAVGSGHYGTSAATTGNFYRAGGLTYKSASAISRLTWRAQTGDLLTASRLTIYGLAV